MSITKLQRNRIINKTGIPLSEMFNDSNQHKKNTNQWIPAEKVMLIQLLTEIKEELKKLNEKS